MRDPITSDTSFKWLDGSELPYDTTENSFSNWYSAGTNPASASSGQHCVYVQPSEYGRTCPAGGWVDPNSGSTTPCVAGGWTSRNCDDSMDRIVCDLSNGETGFSDPLSFPRKRFGDEIR